MADYQQLLGNDAVVYKNQLQQQIFISCHLSNSKNKFMTQVSELGRLIDENPTLECYVCGDFNARAFQVNETTLGFYRKNLREEERIASNIIIQRDFGRKISINIPNSFSTNKCRIQTTQLAKMFQITSDAIDFIFCVSPMGESESDKYIKTVFSTYQIFGNILEGLSFPPVAWPSDHAMVVTTFSSHTSDVKLLSWNVCGESCCGDEAFNWAEFATEGFYHIYSTDHNIKSTINDIIAAQPAFGDKSWTENVKCNTFGSILRNCDLMNIHKPPSSGAINRDSAYYKRLSLAFNTALKGLEMEYETIRSHANFIINFFDELINHPNLADLFADLFNEVASTEKMRVSDILLTTLRNPIYNNVMVIALQEVSMSILEDINRSSREFNSLGYELVFDSTSGTKTIGVLIVRMRDVTNISNLT